MLKVQPRVTFEKCHELGALYTGGKVQLMANLAMQSAAEMDTESEQRFSQVLITASGEDIFVTDLETGKRVLTLSGDSEVITSFAVRPRHVDQPHQHLVTASRSRQLTLWDLGTGKVVRQWRAHEAPVLMMEFDPSGRLLATGSADSTIICWDIDKQVCTHTLRGHAGVISALKFHPDADRWMLFSGSDDCHVRVWDLLTRSCSAVLDGHNSVVRSFSVTPDGWTLLTAGRDKIVNAWDLRKFKLLKTVPVLETIESVGILSGESLRLADENAARQLYFFTAGDKGRIRFWGLQSGECVREVDNIPGTPEDTVLTDAFYDPVAESLVALTSDMNIIFHSIADDLKISKVIIGYNDEIIDMDFVGEDRSDLAVITNCGQLRFFDLMTGNSNIVYAHNHTILSMDYSHEKSLLCTGSKDHSAKIWELTKGASSMDCNLVAECIGHADAIGAIAFSKKTQPGFLMTSSHDLTVKRWALLPQMKSATRLKAAYTVKCHDKEINSLAVAPNDKLFATGSQDKTAKLWNCEDGSLVATLKGHRRGVWSVQFSPVDQVLATSSGDKTIKLWSLSDMTCVRTFEGHTHSVLRVKFLSLGTQMLSTGSDGLTKLWNVKTSDCVSTLDDHEDKIWALAIREPPASILSSADGAESIDQDPFSMNSAKHCTIATGSGDAIINIYRDVTASSLRELHLKQETKMLQEQDLSNYLLKKDYKNAILLALRLGQPGRLCALFTEVLESEEKEDAILGKKVMDRIIAELSPNQLEMMLDYIRTWNTNAKLAMTAQAVLHAVLKQKSHSDLIKLPKIKELLDSMIPYTERHYSRVDSLQTKSWLVDYALHEMDTLLGMDEIPEGSEAKEKGIKRKMDETTIDEDDVGR